VIIEPSPFQEGERGLAVECYQGLMRQNGCPWVEETGEWTAQNEHDYITYQSGLTWIMFFTTMSSPGERLLDNWIYV
jgi:hypothetical protein